MHRKYVYGGVVEGDVVRNEIPTADDLPAGALYDDDGDHAYDCACYECQDYAEALQDDLMDRRSEAERERDEANEMAEARKKWQHWREAPAADEQWPADPDAMIAAMLQGQETQLDGPPVWGTPGACTACGKPLPTDDKGRGRPRKFHPKCKEAAMKRGQRGAEIRQDPEELPPYVIPGYTGYRRPPSEAARRIFRGQD